jgi:hypothetical protein
MRRCICLGLVSGSLDWIFLSVVCARTSKRNAKCDVSSVLKRATETKKNIFITMLSVYGVKKNEHYLGIVTNQLLIDDLLT